MSGRALRDFIASSDRGAPSGSRGRVEDESKSGAGLGGAPEASSEYPAKCQTPSLPAFEAPLVSKKQRHVADQSEWPKVCWPWCLAEVGITSRRVRAIL